MSDSQSAAAPESSLDGRLIERCEAIPETPAPGNYVVVDTLHFSNTVIELLANGASYVHITDERGDELAYQAANPDAKIGGARTPEYEPVEGYDFFNSPSYVQQVDVDGVPVSMTSTNGGRAVARLRAAPQPDLDVYVGSPMNAAALGTYLRSQDRPTYLVSAGTEGAIAVEDHIGATLVSKYLDGLPVSETELELFRKQLQTAKGPDYIDSHHYRRRDVLEYAMQINSRSVLPKLDGDVLRPVS